MSEKGKNWKKPSPNYKEPWRLKMEEDFKRTLEEEFAKLDGRICPKCNGICDFLKGDYTEIIRKNKSRYWKVKILKCRDCGYCEEIERKKESLKDKIKRLFN